MNERHSPIDPACTDHHGYEERKKYGCTGPDPGQYVYSGDQVTAYRPATRDEKIVNPGVYQVPDNDAELVRECTRLNRDNTLLFVALTGAERQVQRVRDVLATSVVKTSDLYHAISEALGDDDDE